MVNNLTSEKHCLKEISTFTKSNYYTEIKKKTNILGYELDCKCGDGELDRKDKIDIYFGIAIIDSNGEIIVADKLDCDHLCAATCVFRLDKRNNVHLMSWKDDEEFIDSVEWIMSELDKMLKT